MNYPDTHHDTYSKTVFGFWLYLLTDFVLFATLLASYFVLRGSTFGGPTAAELFPLPFTLVQSLILLGCSFTSGIAGVFAHQKRKWATFHWFILTFILGALFLWMEWEGCLQLIEAGNDWRRSAFLSAYFTLLGTHAVHIVFALLWTLVLLFPIVRQGFTSFSLQRLTCLRLFWQFINLIWVGIFTIVYLMGEN